MKKLQTVLGLITMFLTILLCKNVTEAAQQLETNAPTQISTSEESYDFTIEQQGKVVLSALPIEGEQYVYGEVTLYEVDEDGNEIEIVSDGACYDYSGKAEQLETSPVRLWSGTYLIKYECYGADGRSKEYHADLTIQYTKENASEYESEKNDGWSTANKIALNNEYRANLQSQSDVDMYQFDLEQEGSLYLHLRNTGTTADRWNVELYAVDGNGNRNLIDSWTNTTNKNSKFTKYRLPVGTYYVKVTPGRFFTTNDYSIGTVYVAETSDDSEIEYNDTLSTANGIAVNSEYKGNISTTKDVDYYRFTLEQAAKITLQVKQENDQVTAGLYSVALYRKNEDDSMIMYDRFHTMANVISQGNEVKVPAGTYIVCIKNNNGTVEDQNDYIVKVVEEEIDEEIIAPDIPYDVEGESGIPVSINTTLQISAQECRYLFTVPKDGVVVIHALPVDDEQYVYGRLTLYQIDEDENEIEIGSDGERYNYSGESDQLETSPVCLQKGTYVIKYECYGYDGRSTNDNADLTIQYSEIPDLTKAVIAPIDAQIYTGASIVPKLKVTYQGKTLEEKKDYTVSCENNKSAGTATVTIHPIENQSVGTQSASFTIIKADATISIHTGTYTKSTGDAAFALTGIHTNSDGKVKYSVTQGKEVVSVNAFGQVTLLKAGTAVIRVSVPATGNYNESTTKTIRILVKDESTKITNTKAKITKTTNKKGKKIALKLSGATQGAGYEIQYGTKSNFKSAKTVKKSSNSVTLNKLKKGKKYFIRVRIYKKIGNDIYYGKWSSKKTVKIKK